MIAVIDTSSLLSMVRYYLPFDGNDVLIDLLKSKILAKEIIVIDKVHGECKLQSQGIVLEKLQFLSENGFQKQAKTPYNTSDLIAPNPAKILRQVDSNFANLQLINAKQLTPAEYEVEKSKFVDGADFKQVILCLKLKNDSPLFDVILITEESKYSNDQKYFKKLPAICEQLGIKTLSIAEYLCLMPSIDISIFTKSYN